jgi:protocatechuate 3,4-dioxygenase, alpha subunit
LCDENIATVEGVGDRIAIEGCVFDGDGAPVPDALLEIWQADAKGKHAYNDVRDEGSKVPDGFRGFGRVATNEQGRFRFVSVKPGGVKDAEGREQSPHLLVSIFMRGLLARLVTRIYFPEEPRNADDTVLGLVPAERRDTLIAKSLGREDGLFEWNVVLQGTNETVFFAC